MSEFGMRHTNSYNAGQQPMEWYSAGAAGAGGGGGGGGQQQQYGNYAYSAPPQAAPVGGGYGGGGPAGGGFEEEAPLLEELGIDVGLILQRTKAIILHQMRSGALDELDMGGALIFLMLLAGLHLLSGKMHFGVVLGWSVLQSLLLHFIVNQVASGESSEVRPLDLYSCCCISGYGMVPLCVLSVLLLLLPKGGPAGWLLAVLCAAWSAATASKVLAKVSPALSEVRGLVAVPCFLMYSSFALLTIY